MVVPLLQRAETSPSLHRQRVGLGAVWPEETVPQAVKAVGPERCRHELVRSLMEQLIVDDPILATASGAIQRHLEILVVNGDLMVRELGVRKYAQRAGLRRLILQRQIPQFHRFPSGYKQGLGGGDPMADALVHGVAQPMTASVVPQIPAAGLHQYSPVSSSQKVNIVPRAIHGYAIRPKPGDTVVLWALVKQVAPGSMVDYGGQILYAEIIGPGYRHIHPVNDILPL